MKPLEPWVPQGGDIEVLLDGLFGPDAVETCWSSVAATRSLPGVESAIAAAWEEAQRRAERAGHLLFPGPLCRLERAGRTEAGRLQLAFSPTDYRAFVGTNLNLETLRRLAGEREDEVLANPTGVSAVVRTADDFILLGRRSQRTLEYPGCWHVPGGHVEPRHVLSGGAHVFDAVRDEVIEETGVSAEDVRGCFCTGLLRTRQTRKPELTFLVELACSRQDLPTVPANDEHTQWRYLRGRPEDVMHFLGEHPHDLTPAGRGCLLLYARAA